MGIFPEGLFSCTPDGMYLFIYLLFYVTFNSQGHIATGSLQVEESSAYCTVNHRASASNYQLSNMKRPARWDVREAFSVLLGKCERGLPDSTGGGEGTQRFFCECQHAVAKLHSKKPFS